jgi:hypothetical protein
MKHLQLQYTASHLSAERKAGVVLEPRRKAPALHAGGRGRVDPQPAQPGHSGLDRAGFLTNSVACCALLVAYRPGCVARRARPGACASASHRTMVATLHFFLPWTARRASRSAVVTVLAHATVFVSRPLLATRMLPLFVEEARSASGLPGALGLSAIGLLSPAGSAIAASLPSRARTDSIRCRGASLHEEPHRFERGCRFRRLSPGTPQASRVARPSLAPPRGAGARCAFGRRSAPPTSAPPQRAHGKARGHAASGSRGACAPVCAAMAHGRRFAGKRPRKPRLHRQATRRITVILGA